MDRAGDGCFDPSAKCNHDCKVTVVLKLATTSSPKLATKDVHQGECDLVLNGRIPKLAALLSKDSYPRTDARCH